MRLVIGTPAYGGLFHDNYLHSMVETVAGLAAEGITFTLRTVAHEALIGRARNTIADYAIRTDADKLLFIDADLGWTWKHVQALLQSDKLVVGGTYPVKQLPVRLNYNVKDEQAWIYGPEKIQTLEAHRRLQALADPRTGEVAVKHVPAGFLLIDIKVFYALQKTADQYWQYRRNQPPKPMWNFFPIRVHQGMLESEDWGFCSICQQNDIDVYLNTTLLLTHRGSHLFEMT